MIKRVDFNGLFKSKHGWLNSSFHFSFAEYYRKDNVHFGALRVMNDDNIAPHTGFDTHPHKDMEIFTYILSGKLTHQDSMGNKETLGRGDVQYMSAGTGVYHSEKNENDENLRLIQTWILPDVYNHTPDYGSKRYTKEDRSNKWLHILSGKDKNAIHINQDIEVLVSELDSEKTLIYKFEDDRQIYLKVMEGMVSVNGEKLFFGDACEIMDESEIVIKAEENSHLMLIDLSKNFK
ncbi:MAG: pirin family protein [Campylobacteraceae bacterium]